MAFKDYEFKADAFLPGSKRMQYMAFIQEEMVAEAMLVPPVGGFCSFITDLGVHPKHRRNGLGSKIVRDILASQSKPVQVHLSPHHWPGEDPPPFTVSDLKNFYARLGFKEIKCDTPSMGEYMIWYPDGAYSEIIKVSVESLGGGAGWTAKLPAFECIGGCGRSSIEAVGCLVTKHQKLFRTEIEFPKQEQ